MNKTAIQNTLENLTGQDWHEFIGKEAQGISVWVACEGGMTMDRSCALFQTENGNINLVYEDQGACWSTQLTGSFEEVLQMLQVEVRVAA